jgi:hypothetical protein
MLKFIGTVRYDARKLGQPPKGTPITVAFAPRPTLKDCMEDR